MLGLRRALQSRYLTPWCYAMRKAEGRRYNVTASVTLITSPRAYPVCNTGSSYAEEASCTGCCRLSDAARSPQRGLPAGGWPPGAWPPAGPDQAAPGDALAAEEGPARQRPREDAGAGYAGEVDGVAEEVLQLQVRRLIGGGAGPKWDGPDGRATWCACGVWKSASRPAR